MGAFKKSLLSLTTFTVASYWQW